MPRGDRKQQIMHAAERLFTSRPPGTVTTDEIAKAARVGKGTIYKYFRDKEDLFFQTATLGFEQLCELIRGSAPGEALFAEQLMSACQQIIAFFQDRRRLFGIMQSEDSRMSFSTGKIQHRWMETRRTLVTSVAEVIAKGVAEGQVRRDIEPEVLAGYLLGMLRARARDLTDVPEDRRSPDMLVNLFFFGAAHSGPAAGLFSRRSAAAAPAISESAP
jgi:AcrR family transcriptional regulator